MGQNMKKYLAILLGIFIFSQTCYVASAEDAMELSAKTAIIMEAETGKVLYEKEADQALPPASVTKVMTLLLIFDALEEGKIALEDEVTTSEYAASMGGSQVFLEPGEKQTVDTLINCIAVASANDACVAMAEKISGTEELFVQQMNARASELGMEHTTFVNCNGLDADGHVTSARDIALMSRELILRHPQIFQYTQIWMENITHVTAKGSSEFGLTNTNKLIRQYEYATGLKTGSTSGAGFCLSGTAEKDGIQMIAVVMGEPDAKTRTKDVIAMLNYGFGKCNIYTDETVLEERVYTEVVKGKEDTVEGICESDFKYVDFDGKNLSEIEKNVEMKKIEAPVVKGDKLGEVIYSLNGEQIGMIPILAKKTIKKMTYVDAICEVLEKAATF